MKKLFKVVAILLSSFGANAQLTLQHDYFFTAPQSYYFSVVDLLLSGKKYCLFNVGANSITLYNLNYSVWKTINPPAVTGLRWYSMWGGGRLGYVSENLFKIDNKVDVVLSYVDSATSSIFSTLIIDENAAIINRIDSTWDLEVYNIGVDSFVAASVSKQHVAVYSVPGKLPCNLCGSAPGLGLPINSNSGGGSSLISNPVPNPSSGSVKIEYSVPPGTTGIIRVFNTMGKELKSYKVDHNFDYITLDNAELPSGIYYYNLTTSDMQTSAKKMIVVR